MKRTPRIDRLWEIDTLRGVAILMMITYHLVWDLWAFAIVPDIDPFNGFWKYFQRATAGLFLTLVGVSLVVVTLRRLAPKAGPHDLPPVRPYLWRALRIFGWGMVVSAVMFFSGMGYVHFGILHLIGFASIAAYPFLRYKWPNLILWLLFNTAGYFLMDRTWDFPWLLWLGWVPINYYPNDYFPVIPYFGVVSLGIFLGNSLYRRDGRRFPLPDLGGFLPLRGLQWLGKRSLIIYLIHQPLLFAILWALGFIQM